MARSEHRRHGRGCAASTGPGPGDCCRRRPPWRHHHGRLGCPAAPLAGPGVLGDGIASALYVGNYWFVIQGVDYFAGHMPPSPFQHYWSLGVEEQFYLVWPALIIGTAWLIRRVRRRTRAEATSSERPYLVVLAWSRSYHSRCRWRSPLRPPAAFFSLPTRAWQLAVGGLVALTAGQWRRLPPRAAAIAGWAGLA